MQSNELPDDIKELAVKNISEANELPPLWKASPEEPYALRRFHPSRSEDTQRFKDIDRHPEVNKWMIPEEPSSNQDLDSLLNTNEADRTDPRIIWAVVDKKGEAVGWVQFYEDEHLSQEERDKMEIPKDALILEVSYAKLFNEWPKGTDFIEDRDNLLDTDYGGVAVSGLRQALIRIREMENTVSSTADPPRKIYITAYTDSKNTASEAVLSKNDFQNVEQTKYDDGEVETTWIREV